MTLLFIFRTKIKVMQVTILNFVKFKFKFSLKLNEVCSEAQPLLFHTWNPDRTVELTDVITHFPTNGSSVSFGCTNENTVLLTQSTIIDSNTKLFTSFPFQSRRF